MWLLADQLEAGCLVDPPGGGQDVVGPQGDPVVSGSLRELQAGLDQTGPQAQSTRNRIDEQDPELRRTRFVPGDAEDAPRSASVDLGDPGRFGRRVVGGRVVGHDPGDQRLEVGVPAELVGVHRAVGQHHPAEITGLPHRPDHRTPIIRHRHLLLGTDTTVSVGLG